MGYVARNPKDTCVSWFKHNQSMPGQVDKLVEHLKFDTMKKNPNANPTSGMDLEALGKTDFMRKGQVGVWKNFFTPEKTEEWAAWIEEKTKGTGLIEKIAPL